MRRLALRVRLVAEPSGAVTFAAYLFHREELPASRLTVAVISGGNVEPGLLARVLSTRSRSAKPFSAAWSRRGHRRGQPERVVDQVASEKTSPSDSVGCERTQWLLAAGTGSWSTVVMAQRGHGSATRNGTSLS